MSFYLGGQVPFEWIGLLVEEVLVSEQGPRCTGVELIEYSSDWNNSSLCE